MAREIPVPDYIPEKLRQKYLEMEDKRLDDVEVFNAWWEQLSDERKQKYSSLKLFSTDSSGTRKEEKHPYHLRMCKVLLEVADRAKSDDGRSIWPVAMAIHGSHPVIFFDTEEFNMNEGRRNRDEMSITDHGDETDDIYCDIDLTNYGFTCEDGGIFHFKIKKEVWREVEKWMKDLVLDKK